MHCSILLLLVLCELTVGFPPSLDGKIVDGQDVNITDYKYQLSLEVITRGHICGASLIEKQWAITAAHCTYKRNASSFIVRGGTSKRQKNGQVVKINNIYNHPNFTPSTIDYDIALLKLEGEFFHKDCAVIDLANEGKSEDIPEGEIAVVTGWGAVLEGGKGSEQLQMVMIPVVDLSKCRKAYGADSITDRMLCAGKLGKDSCQGDSGGPLVINNKLTGLVSWGQGCARPGFPGVYTSIPALREWINSIINV